MSYTIEVPDDAIDRVRNKATSKIDSGGTHYFGMTYEQGLDDAIRWLTGESDEEPLEEIDDTAED